MNKRNRFINYLNHIVFSLMALGMVMSPVEAKYLLDIQKDSKGIELN